MSLVLQNTFKAAVILAVVGTVYLFLRDDLVKIRRTRKAGGLSCDTMDVVYTWVNGSDPVHRRNLKKVGKAEGKEVAANGARFRDYGALLYSLRSIRKNFPDARLVHVVIADEEGVPSWMNVSAPGIRIVRHSQIMEDWALPTFNSNGIESNLHLIPDLAECFLYLNDDMFLGRQMNTELYWDYMEGKQKVHLGKWKAPMKEKMKTNSWHRAVARTNDELNNVYGKQKRQYAVHGCYFFHKEIFTKMREMFDESFRATLSRPFRGEKDLVISFLYVHVAINTFKAIPGPYQLQYVVVKPDAKENIQSWRKMIARPPICACINDGLRGREDKAARRAILELQQALEYIFPDPSPWERLDRPHIIRPGSKKYFYGSDMVGWILKALLAVPLVIIGILVFAATVFYLLDAQPSSKDAMIDRMLLEEGGKNV